MKFRKTVSLKDSRECLLRNPEGGDAGAILRHLIQTSGETGFMARYADEIVLTEEQERAYLAQLESDPKAGMVSAVVDQSIVANAGFNPVATLEKYCHRAEFGMSVQKNYWGMGIGSSMSPAYPPRSASAIGSVRFCAFFRLTRGRNVDYYSDRYPH